MLIEKHNKPFITIFMKVQFNFKQVMSAIPRDTKGQMKCLY